MPSLDKRMLAHGLFKGAPIQRKHAAAEFESHGYSIVDLDRLVDEAKARRPAHHLGVVREWLRDEDGELRGRILELREVAREDMAADRTDDLELPEDQRRVRALHGVAAMVSDDATLEDAVAHMSAEFQLVDPITVAEATDSEIVGAARRAPSPHARTMIQAMVDRAKAEAIAARDG